MAPHERSHAVSRTVLSSVLLLAIFLLGAREAMAQTITTYAGNGTVGFAGDGSPATAAALNQPGSVAVDAAGDVFINHNIHNRIRRVDAGTGIIPTVPGDGAARFRRPRHGGASGGGGPATAA